MEAALADPKAQKHFDLGSASQLQSRVSRIPMPEINTDEIFQKILEDASNDFSIYKILTSALHICRTELVT